MMKELMVYLKTTETCQLNCKHCFTSGSSGRRIFFDPDKVIDFFHRLKQVSPNISSGNISFHGGEPMLAPIKDMEKVYESCKDLWDNVWWSIQSNLVYKLDDEKLAFFDKITKRQTFGTSYDIGIRFPSYKAEELWKENVRTLVGLGYPVTVMVSLTSEALKLEPVEIIQRIADLGVKYINFERMTHNGNARTNDYLTPGNKALDQYFVKMWDQTIQYDLHKKIKNVFFDSILTSLVHSAHAGCRCRMCEQKVLTLNADGTIGGCPNSAVEKPYARIEWPLMEILYSKGRMKEIACEAVRHPGCAGCEVFDICNGDCHQLAWEGDICPAPKTLMKQLKNDTDFAVMKEVVQDFVGTE